jgi:integrase
MSKRGPNEGSIYLRKDGRWAASIEIGFENGIRRRKHYLGRTRREVQEKLNEAVSAKSQGMPVSVKRQTVAQFFNDWLENTKKPSVRQRTYESYESVVRLHIVPAIGHIQLANLTPQDVTRLINKKLQSGQSPTTALYVKRVLGMGLKHAMMWGELGRNVATLVPSPKIEREEVRALSPEETRQFLAVLKGDRTEALFVVATSLGLRLGEVLGLSWDDVDLEGQKLSVRKQLQRIGGKLVRTEPKTRRSRRTIGLPSIAVDALREHRIRQFEERLIAGERWVDTGLIFTTTIGTPFEQRNVRRHLDQLLDRVGLPHINPHALRHTAASLLLAQGVHPRVIMETLGHSQISTTMNLYAHVMGEVQREAAESMDRILRSG